MLPSTATVDAPNSCRICYLLYHSLPLTCGLLPLTQCLFPVIETLPIGGRPKELREYAHLPYYPIFLFPHPFPLSRYLSPIAWYLLPYRTLPYVTFPLLIGDRPSKLCEGRGQAGDGRRAKRHRGA